MLEKGNNMDTVIIDDHKFVLNMKDFDCISSGDGYGNGESFI